MRQHLLHLHRIHRQAHHSRRRACCRRVLQSQLMEDGVGMVRRSIMGALPVHHFRTRAKHTRFTRMSSQRGLA